MSTRKEILQQTKERLAIYIEAEKTVLKGASYSIGNRTWTGADLSDIRAEITKLNKQCISLEGSGNVQVRRAVFRDI